MKLILFLSLVAGAFACSNKPGPETTTAASTTTAGADPLTECFGEGVSQEVYDNSEYANNAGPVEEGSALDCDFSGSCCWENDEAEDQLQFNTITGSADPAAVQECFGTSETPSGDFLASVSPTANSGSDEAWFYSCPILCAQSDVTVSLKHWITPGASLEVCTRDSLAGGAPSNCQSVPSTSPGPDEVTLPAGEGMEIVLVASGQTDPEGSIVAVDDVTVQYDPCVDTTTTTTGAPGTTTTSGAAAPCLEVACSFDQGDACAYLNTGDSVPEWEVYEAGEVAGNPDTGVDAPEMSRDTSFLAVENVFGEQSAVAESAPFEPVTPGTEIAFEYYEATDLCALKVCFDGVDDCPFTSNPSVSAADREWKEASVAIPDGASTVNFVCDNSQGEYFCSCGVDSIDLCDAAGCLCGTSDGGEGGLTTTAFTARSRLQRFRSLRKPNANQRVIKKKIYNRHG